MSFLLTLLSTAGIVLLASYQAYNDGGAQLRTSYLHAAGVQEYYDHVEPVLEGLVHEPQSYQNYLNSLNVHVDVKTTDGTTVFSNAKEGETSLLEGPDVYKRQVMYSSSSRTSTTVPSGCERIMASACSASAATGIMGGLLSGQLDHVRIELIVLAVLLQQVGVAAALDHAALLLSLIHI